MFQKRLKEEKPIHLHEFLYPLMQGYDSVFVSAEVWFSNVTISRISSVIGSVDTVFSPATPGVSIDSDSGNAFGLKLEFRSGD
jgi:hypothetical protein